MTVVHLVRDGPPWQSPGDVECGANMNEIRAGLAVAWQSRENGPRGQALFAMPAGSHEWCSECRRLIDYVYHGFKPTWEANPAGVIAQQANGDPSATNDDLRALAALVDRHRDEYEVIRWGQVHRWRLT